MSRPLLPLNALRAFEATARHLSFTKASEELHVTPAALSHHIKGLEDLLGAPLFVRQARTIHLTETGRTLYPGLHTGFETLRGAVARVDRTRQDRILVVSATPGLTAKWLVPRLYRFLAAHPDIDARISANMACADFVSDGVDVAIRLSPGLDPDLHMEKLTDEWVMPLCSPRLLEGPDGLRTPDDLGRFTLIHYELPMATRSPPTWAYWCETAGVEGIDTTRGLRLNVADHALDAAIAGVGVVLAYRLMALGDMASGRLVQPFGPAVPLAAYAYHFVCPRGSEQRPKIRAFRDWLFSEIEEARATPPAEQRVREPAGQA